MDFTEIYRQSSSLVAFSPGGHFILTAVEDRIIVRRTDTFQITRTWLVDASPSPTNVFFSGKSSSKAKSSSGPISDDWVTHCGWSCDSEYIFAAFTKRGVVHVLKLRDENWSGRIEAGTEGNLHILPRFSSCAQSIRPYEGRMGSRRTNDLVLLGMGCASVLMGI
jgi:hypothetical protein